MNKMNKLVKIKVNKRKRVNNQIIHKLRVLNKKELEKKIKTRIKMQIISVDYLLIG
jgi:hypothetical protein